MTPGYDADPLGFAPEEKVARHLRMHPDRASKSGTLWNRNQKIMFPPGGARWSIYCDGSISPKVKVAPLADKWLADSNVAMFKHPHRTCAYLEIDACVTRNKITPTEGELARKTLSAAGFPKDFGLWACGMIARRTNNNSFQEMVAPVWWGMVEQVARDQIWLPFAMWKLCYSASSIHTIDEDIFDNPYFTFKPHRA